MSGRWNVDESDGDKEDDAVEGRLSEKQPLFRRSSEGRSRKASRTRKGNRPEISLTIRHEIEFL